MNFLKLGSFLAVAVAALTAQKAQAANWTYSSPTSVPATCPGLDSTGSATDFQITPVVWKTNTSTIQNPLKLAFVVKDTSAAGRLRTNPAAHADFVYIQRFGQVYYYSDSLQTATLIGNISGKNLSYSTEDGLIGVTVDRQFANRIFLSYAHSNSGCTGGNCGPTNATATVPSNGQIDGSWRLSVFSMDPVTHMIDTSSEKVVLDVPTYRNRWHTGGALNMDNSGNLYWTIGDNETAFTGPGNTHSMRGGILRIHPNAGVAAGYTIPSGNLWEVASASFTAAGKTSLANKYRDTSLVRHEIYVKGTRNAYVAQVNPYNGVLTYSQCGPDAQDKQSESWNLVGSARFAGWPFWVGTDSVNSSQVSGSQYGKNGNNEPTTSTWNTYLPGSNTGVVFNNTNSIYPNYTTTPVVNTWRHDTVSGFGVDTLPTYVVQSNAMSHSLGGSCAMGATYWYYDGRVANPNKFPPQMNNVWFNGAYSATRLQATKAALDTTPQGVNGKMLGSISNIFSSFTTAKKIAALVDLQEGPDGALYVLNYGCNGGNTSSGTNVTSDSCSGIFRIELKTSSTSQCVDTHLIPSGVVGIAQQAFGSSTPNYGDVNWMKVTGQSLTIGTLGAHTIQIMNMQGRVVRSLRGDGPKEYSLSELPGNQIYLLKVQTNLGTALQRFIHF